MCMSVFLPLQEQDSSYTIIKSKETEMVVEGLKPSSVYIFQVKLRIKNFKRELIKDTQKQNCKFYMWELQIEL